MRRDTAYQWPPCTVKAVVVDRLQRCTVPTVVTGSCVALGIELAVVHCGTLIAVVMDIASSIGRHQEL